MTCHDAIVKLFKDLSVLVFSFSPWVISWAVMRFGIPKASSDGE